MRKILLAPGFWILLSANIYILVYYLQYPDSIHTVIALFWIQSVMIGIFNALDMLTLTNTVDNSFTINDKPGNRQGCAGLFFLFHYSFFHFVYIFFLVPSIIDLQKLDWRFIKVSFWLLLASSVIEFIYSKRRNRVEKVNISYMMFMPYARILPMHLLILLPGFLHISAPAVFIALKIVADLVMFIMYQKVVYRPITETTT